MLLARRRPSVHGDSRRFSLHERQMAQMTIFPGGTVNELIQCQAEHWVGEQEIIAHCQQRHGIGEISDGAAVAIAVWFQSPGRTGRHLAALASGAAVSKDDVRTDIRASRQVTNNPEMHVALDMLSTWVLHRAAVGVPE